MKKYSLMMLLMVVALFALAACDAAIPGAESEVPEAEDPVTDAAPENVEAPEETIPEEAAEPAEEPAPEEDLEAGGRIVTAWIGPELVDCVGVGPQKCMQVKTNPDDEYGLFYDQIEGFAYEEGYEYELRVLVEPVQDPPADASALIFTLVEVISQTPAAAAEQPAVGELPAGEELTLEGQTWLLSSYAGQDGEQIEALPQTRVTITFAEGEVSGSGGCNNFFGPYEVNGSELSIGLLGSTMMACVDDVMAQETGYLANLGAVAGYQIDGEQLHLLGADGQLLLVYTVDASTPLTGTIWTVTSYNNGRGAVTGVIMGTEMNAVFAEIGLVSGSAGCNDYRAGFESSGNNISIGPAAVTRKLCAEPEGIMEQEAQYLAALETAATYEIAGPRMDLYDESGARVAIFEAAGSVAETAKETVDLPVVAGDGSDAAVEEGSLKTIYVGPEMVECEGEGPQQCLLVKEDPNAEYQLHYFPIQGFNFEPGYEYELIIREETIENPPAGGSSLNWVLVEEVSRTAVEGTEQSLLFEAAELSGTSWQWLAMVTPVESVTVDDPGSYTLEFLADNTVAIQADCNSGSGTYEADGSSLSISITATTLALCPEGSLSDLFIRNLNAAAIQFTQDGNLFIDLFADAGTMEFAPNE